MREPAKKRSLLLWIAVALMVCLVVLVCVDYFVLQHPIFDRSGWYTTDAGQVQYRDYYAKPLTGWQTIDGNKYYFGEDGIRYSGWLDTEDGRCYLGKDGALHTGWLELDGMRYYMDSEGQLYTGWLEQADGKVYLNEDGAIHTGWLEQADGKVYLNEDGVIHTGWLDQPEGKYLMDAEGYFCTGWVENNGLRYYFREDGTLNENWQDSEEGLTYVVDGKPYTGWLNAAEGKFYFDENGKSKSGWITDETGRFYLNGDGTFATGFVEIAGVERYFLPTGEYVILCNRWNKIPDDYEMNLVSLGKFKVDASCKDAFQLMVDDAKKEGITIKINNTYRSKSTQQWMWEVRRKKYMNQGMTLAEANAHIGRSVAVPGTSEHQTGLGIDVSKNEKAYKWLAENSWKYGFILRYPDDKIEVTGIIYEPWHFRYVGNALAKDIYESGLCLEEYLEALKK